jgi:hypothetical protein
VRLVVEPELSHRGDHGMAVTCASGWCTSRVTGTQTIVVLDEAGP